VRQNPKCDRLIVAPGNPGIAAHAECAALDILDGDTVSAFAVEQAIDLIIIGPEAPLAAGVADTCRAAGLVVFGPSRAAAQLESSKAFTKSICDACGAPHRRLGTVRQSRCRPRPCAGPGRPHRDQG
jgi:phosphoribosylamine--glycine ligase